MFKKPSILYNPFIFVLAHFEGSLGRLTTSSVHNPRQIIDLQSHDIHEEGQAHSINKELRKARQLLMEIEKVCLSQLSRVVDSLPVYRKK